MNRIIFRSSRRLYQPYLLNLSYRSSTTTILTDTLPSHLVEKARIRDEQLRSEHHTLNAQLTSNEQDLILRRRLIYRAKQRGWLEADILLGSWAAEHVPTLTIQQCHEFDRILQEETIDLYNYVSGKDSLPSHLKDLQIMKALQQYAQSSKIQSPEDYEATKQRTNLT